MPKSAIPQKVKARLARLSKMHASVEESLREANLISELPDGWFHENLIQIVNPAQLIKELKYENPHFKKRDDLIKEILRMWLLSGSHLGRVTFRQAVASILSSKLPLPNVKKSSPASSKLYGLSRTQLMRATPEVARLSYLAGRTRRSSVTDRRVIKKLLQSRREVVDRATTILRTLHCFVAGLDPNLDLLVARDALMDAIGGKQALDEGILENKGALDSTKMLHPRPSRQTLINAWQEYTEQIVILYAISSMSEPDGTPLLDTVFDDKNGAEALFAKIDEIMARAQFINESVLKHLSEAQEWRTVAPRRRNFDDPQVREMTNTRTVELTSLLEAKPVAFEPTPVADDILLMLRKHYKI